jgi:competence protein ComEC
VLLGLLRTPLRWSGAIVLLLATLWALALPQPDVLISGDGRNVAVRGNDGRLHLMHSGKDAFLVKEWLAADADARDAADPSLTNGISCDEAACILPLSDGAFVSLALRPEALVDDCDRAVLIVTGSQAPAGCAATVIDRDRLRRQGAMMLRRSGNGFAIEAVWPNGFERPWSPAARDTSEAGSAVAHGRPRRAVDVTPSETDVQAEE